MRIISGSARGTKLKAPKGMSTRPTADRIKESLFNMLGSLLYEAKVLDLFSGTGSLGLESLSRGAAHAVLIDQAADSISSIKFNVAHTHLEDRCTVLKADVFAALKKLYRKGERFDVIFCDPPYHKELCLRALETLAEFPVALPGAYVIMEHALDDELPDEYGELKLVRRRAYGAVTQLSIYKSMQQPEQTAE